MEKLTIVKVGGKIVEEKDSLIQLLGQFQKIEGHKLLVHGGGRSATQMCDKLGIKTQMLDGRRITNKETLDVVTMVYGGLVNKNIVAHLQGLGIDALGLTGVDMDIIRSAKRSLTNGIDYGYVGDVQKVDAMKLYTLIMHDLVPVIAPLTHDGAGNLLNTNADTIAGSVAMALATSFQVELIFCFEKKGVLRDENDEDSAIDNMNRQDFEHYLQQKVIVGGMIPKITNAFDALDAGVKQVTITHADYLATQSGTKIHL